MAHPPDDLVLRLYQAAREMPTEAFQDHALGLIRPLLRFDTAIWGTGQTDGYSLQIATAFLRGIDPRATEEWIQIGRPDKVIPVGVALPGRTIEFEAARIFDQPEDAVVKDYLDRQGRNRYLITTTEDGPPGSVQWVSLYRPDADDAYTEYERAVCEYLMPHFSEALRINRLITTIDPATMAANDTQPAVALAEFSGRMQFAQQRFLELLCLEWTQADDTTLPAELLKALRIQHLSAGGSNLHVGRRIRFTARRYTDLLLIEARPRTALDALPPRRAQIAWLFATGHTHKAIARKLHISPSTVRNQIRAIYVELGISSREQLLALTHNGF